MNDILDQLDKRDWEIIRWKAKGYTSEQISAQTGLSPKTIRNRFSCIYDKLGVRNSIQMLRIIQQQGIDVWTMEEEK